jgi:putative oxidoreductase
MRVSPKAEANLRDFGLLVLRLVVGGFMLVRHGIPKVERFFQQPIEFGDPLGIGVLPGLSLAVFAEVACAAALMLGLLSRLSTVPLIITMLVAAFVVHADDGFGKQELPLLFAVSYLTILLTGPGRYSLDARIFHRR